MDSKTLFGRSVAVVEGTVQTKLSNKLAHKRSVLCKPARREADKLVGKGEDYYHLHRYPYV